MVVTSPPNRLANENSSNMLESEFCLRYIPQIGMSCRVPPNLGGTLRVVKAEPQILDVRVVVPVVQAAEAPTN